jgi:hypothetical protein
VVRCSFQLDAFKKQRHNVVFLAALIVLRLVLYCSTRRISCSKSWRWATGVEIFLRCCSSSCAGVDTASNALSDTASGSVDRLSRPSKLALFYRKPPADLCFMVP